MRLGAHRELLRHQGILPQLCAAGDPFYITDMTSSLVIERNNNETFIPSRLLRGTVPDTLLESHRFWFSSCSDVFIGYPRSSNRNDIIRVTGNTIFKQENETSFKLASPCFVYNSIFRHLLRIENISHILIWLDREGKICKIELPRLGIRFVPAQNGMFELVDRLGWYLCDYNVKKNAKNKEERSIFRYGVVLNDECNRMIVLVPTHELRRASVLDRNAFSIDLVPCRHSNSWNSTMREFEPYVLYELHTSRAFVQFETLQSKLYLAFLKFMEREYVYKFTQSHHSFEYNKLNVDGNLKPTLRARTPDTCRHVLCSSPVCWTSI